MTKKPGLGAQLPSGPKRLRGSTYSLLPPGILSSGTSQGELRPALGGALQRLRAARERAAHPTPFAS